MFSPKSMSNLGRLTVYRILLFFSLITALLVITYESREPERQGFVYNLPTACWHYTVGPEVMFR